MKVEKVMTWRTEDGEHFETEREAQVHALLTETENLILNLAIDSGYFPTSSDEETAATFIVEHVNEIREILDKHMIAENSL
jgi:hypothetical protein